MLRSTVNLKVKYILNEQINTLIHLSLRQNNYYLNRGPGFSGGNVIRFGSTPTTTPS
jgi:hypothetical protein